MGLTVTSTSICVGFCILLYCELVNSYSKNKMIHIKSRCPIYPRSEVKRFIVPDEKVSWEIIWKEYAPPFYSSPSLNNKPWTDPSKDDDNFRLLKWNEIDNYTNRKSYMGKYKIEGNVPLNPIGRTGLKGRGLLGRWGPNHAADPIVSRWKVIDSIKVSNNISSNPILQVCLIQRKDSGEWAIPGGMVDPGEMVTETLKREFLEEALNSLESKGEDLKEKEQMVSKFFQSGEEVYKGYVDDPRNTDNAWIETVAMNFHDDTGETVGKLPLEAGDDASKVRWVDVSGKLELYASHSDFIRRVAEKLKAHW